MSPRLQILTLALCSGLLIVVSVSAQEPPAPPAGASPPEPISEWLAEVRAQRQASEDRRRAQKEAMDAHRRWIDPWGAAQKEARDQATQRRHEAFMEHIERDRQAFRNLAPWRFEPDPWQEDTSRSTAEPPPSRGTDAAGIAGKTPPSASPYSLPGWDNLWYYRGF
jgi:hypothetical protein